MRRFPPPVLYGSSVDYCTVSNTATELVLCVGVGVGVGVGVTVEALPPPQLQPTQATVIAAITTNPKQAVVHAPRASCFLLRKTSGSRSIGSRMLAVAAPATASVKTTLI